MFIYFVISRAKLWLAGWPVSVVYPGVFCIKPEIEISLCCLRFAVRNGRDRKWTGRRCANGSTSCGLYIRITCVRGASTWCGGGFRIRVLGFPSTVDGMLWVVNVFVCVCDARQ